MISEPELSIATFQNLPLEYQTSIVIDSLENSEIEWSHDIDHNFDFAKDSPILRDLINDLALVYPKLLVAYGELSMDFITNQVTELLIKNKTYRPGTTFEMYHNDYGDGDVNHEKILPIIIGCDDGFILDGWHRFHNYYSKGIQSVPVLKYL